MVPGRARSRPRACLTLKAPGSNNGVVVSAGVVRRLVACLATLGVLGLALLPAEHLHTVRTEDGRHPDVVHRHLAPHAQPGSRTRVGDDDHHDEAVWIVSSFITPASAAHVYPVADLPAEDLPVARPTQADRGRTPSVPASGHDPPWARSYGLRAPPTPLV
jgi:hypothetical protein